MSYDIDGGEVVAAVSRRPRHDVRVATDLEFASLTIDNPIGNGHWPLCMAAGSWKALDLHK